MQNRRQYNFLPSPRIHGQKRKACFRQGKQARRYVHEKGIEAELERVNNTEYYEEDEYEYEW